MITHPAQTPPPTPLSDMVRDANAAGLSFQAMADRAAAAGYPGSKPYFGKLAKASAKEAPTLELLHGIAAALQKPLSVVQRAAAEQYLRYEARELAGYDDDTRVIVAHLAGMAPAERGRWRAMMEASERASSDSV